ncbi:MAG TPA: lamin tail domain-containing protein [Polyangia bacterium]|nr:lamin tail domain-containing protein [Polyangia bacterium]
MRSRQRIRFDAWEVLALTSGTFLVGLVISICVGCTPETDLSKIAPDGTPAGAAPAGTLVDPLAGATEVPLNLASVRVRFPGPMAFGTPAFAVCQLPSTSVSDAIACDGGLCYDVAVGGRLPALTSCRVELGAGSTDEQGAPLPGGLVGVFDTAAEADTTPPAISGVSLSLEGPCVAVTFSTDEPAAGTVVLSAGGVESDVPAGAGAMTFDLAAPTGALPPSTDATLVVRAVDRAGNVAESAAVAWRTPAALPPLAITEVLANAAGAEPAQEFVELRNLGAEDVSTEGLAIADSRGSDALPAATIAPGEYALVVTSAYVATGGPDTPPRAGTQLLRVDARIGADGLSNGGEVTRLLSGDAVVSSYGGWVDVSSVAWAGKSVHRLVQTACDRRDAWNHTPLPATPGGDPP